ncbi:tail protein X [Methylobacterium iners]|uniref:Tail protein n=1 Tax=Methylobacterium iners TaxID=418707 RepID=A0ABQ4S6X4_9HYPH|nr:tail protein X [Methylobacterium iners]GJD97877.1 hypothetical protein OCOJLMKI_5116 [Methylobacterium iners]
MSDPVILQAMREEDRIDVVTKAMLGAEGGGNLEALLKANPGLAAGGLFIPAGRVLVVPSVDRSPQILPSINPWE